MWGSVFAQNVYIMLRDEIAIGFVSGEIRWIFAIGNVQLMLRLGTK